MRRQADAADGFGLGVLFFDWLFGLAWFRSCFMRICLVFSSSVFSNFDRAVPLRRYQEVEGGKTKDFKSDTFPFINRNVTFRVHTLADSLPLLSMKSYQYDIQKLIPFPLLDQTSYHPNIPI